MGLSITTSSVDAFRALVLQGGGLPFGFINSLIPEFFLKNADL